MTGHRADEQGLDRLPLPARRLPAGFGEERRCKDAVQAGRRKGGPGGRDVARLTTPDDYYVVRANALEDNVRFYRVVKGRREQIKGANTKVASNEWHTLELRAENDRFTVSFDGKQLFTAQDNTFGGAGRVGLWTKADSVTYFDTIATTPME